MVCIMGKLEEIIANIFELDPSQIKKEMTPADIETVSYTHLTLPTILLV